MTSRKNINDIRAAKGNTPLVCLTAYTAPMAAILDAHCDIMLVGDSMGMVLYGMDSTLDVSPDIMIAHGKAVMRNAKSACVVIDMPAGSYENSPAQALATARRIMDETGCDAVKLEGGANMAATIRNIVDSGIPVMAHIGLQPQTAAREGSYRAKGRDEADIEKILKDAKAIESAGAFAVVIEATMEPVAAQITQTLSIPTIGIGASAACDGQILVTDDMLGLLRGHTPKFVKKYAALDSVIEDAVKTYAADVRARAFPSAEFTYNKKTP